VIDVANGCGDTSHYKAAPNDEGFMMGLRKQIEFEIGNRTYRVEHSLDNTYDIHGFNSLSNKVSIETDLNTGERLFVNWSQVPVLRFTDAPGGDAR
jgi:hypothetical protein